MNRWIIGAGIAGLVLVGSAVRALDNVPEPWRFVATSDSQVIMVRSIESGRDGKPRAWVAVFRSYPLCEIRMLVEADCSRRRLLTLATEVRGVDGRVMRRQAVDANPAGDFVGGSETQGGALVDFLCVRTDNGAVQGETAEMTPDEIERGIAGSHLDLPSDEECKGDFLVQNKSGEDHVSFK